MLSRRCRCLGYGDHLESTVDLDIRTRQADAPEGFEDVIGALVPLRDGEPPHSHVTFTISDPDEAAAAAEQLGGTVLARRGLRLDQDDDVCDPQGGAVCTASQFTPPIEWTQELRIGRCTAGTCDSRSRPRVGQGAADRADQSFPSIYSLTRSAHLRAVIFLLRDEDGPVLRADVVPSSIRQT